MKTYDFKQVSCVLGPSPLTGFADGDGMTVEYESNLFNLTVGADGESTRAKTNNRSAKIMIRLQKTSPANDILNEYYQADKLSNGGVFPLLIKDNNGTELHGAEQCWIEKEPNAPFGAESPVREWTLRTDNLNSIFGGNI